MNNEEFDNGLIYVRQRLQELMKHRKIEIQMEQIVRKKMIEQRKLEKKIETFNKMTDLIKED